MRVAQRFAGYTLEEADNLRKACGKKIRAMIQAEREKFVAGCETQGYGRRRSGTQAVRHHRALRRLRLQQVALLRLRARRVPDGVAQGPLPGGVLRRPADVGQRRQGQDRHLPRRVPHARHRGARPRRQPLGGGVHPARRRGRRPPHRVRPGGGAQRGGEPRRPDRGRARRPTARSPTSTTSASASTPWCSTSAPWSRSSRRGRSTRSATPARACASCSRRSSTAPSSAGARSRPGSRRLFSTLEGFGEPDGEAGAGRLRRPPGARARHRVRQDPAPGLREGDARPVRERPPPAGLRGGRGPAHGLLDRPT